jgi:hypothetical protein
LIVRATRDEGSATQALSIHDDGPRGTGRVHYALRLAPVLRKRDAGVEEMVFVRADAVVGAREGQSGPLATRVQSVC